MGPDRPLYLWSHPTQAPGHRCSPDSAIRWHYIAHGRALIDEGPDCRHRGGATPHATPAPSGVRRAPVRGGHPGSPTTWEATHPANPMHLCSSCIQPPVSLSRRGKLTSVSFVPGVELELERSNRGLHTCARPPSIIGESCRALRTETCLDGVPGGAHDERRQHGRGIQTREPEGSAAPFHLRAPGLRQDILAGRAPAAPPAEP